MVRKHRVDVAAAALVWALAALLLAACDSQGPSVGTPTPTDLEGALGAVTVTPVPSPVGLDEDDRIAVYVSVINEMLDNEGKEVRHIYINPYIGQGEHLDSPDEASPIPGTLPPALKKADPTGQRDYVVQDFVESTGPIEGGGKVNNGGVFVTLGPIVNAGGKADSVEVRASIFREAASAEGNIYSLVRDSASETGWKVVTTTQEWSSKDQQP